MRRNKLRKITKKSLAIALCGCLLSTTTFLNLGGEKTLKAKEKYIKELKISVAGDDEAAKQQLENKGYEVISQNLNQNAYPSNFVEDSKKPKVYLGYKTTTDVNEAITDISTMNTNGKYDFASYETVLKNMRENVSGTVEQLIALIKKYRALSQSDKKPKSFEVVKELLANLIDDDTQENLAELFKNKTKEECSDEELEDGKKHADLTKMVVEGNAKIIAAVELALSMIASGKDTTWLKDMSTMTKESFIEKYKKLFLKSKGKSGKGATVPDETAISFAISETETKVNEIRNAWLGLNDLFKNYENSGITIFSKEEEIKKVFPDKSDAWLAWYESGVVYEGLKGMKYSFDGEEKTMLDIFNVHPDQYEENKLTPLVVAAACMTNSEIAVANEMSLFKALQEGFTDTETQVKDKLKEAIGEVSELSVYEGVDREFFKSGVALTEDTMTAQSIVKGNNLWEYILHRQDKEGKIIRILNISAGAFFGASLLTKTMEKYLLRAASKSVIQKAEATEVIEDLAEEVVDDVESVSQSVLDEAYESSSEEIIYTVEDKLIGTTYSKFLNKVVKTLRVIRVVAVVVLVFVTIVDIIEVYRSAREYYERKEQLPPIPKRMVHAVKLNDNEEYKYVNYNAVTGFDNEPGDLNGDGMRQWLALYTTKDRFAGAPITADMIALAGNREPDVGYVGVHMFGESAAVNVADIKYGSSYQKDSVIKLYYRHTSKDSTIATVVAKGSLVLHMFFGIFIGIILGFVIFRLYGRKKSKKQGGKAYEK